MARTMEALVKSRPEPGLWMEEVPVPEPGINDVLIRILKTGICGTDVHIYNWDAWAEKTIPMGLVGAGLRMAERFAPEFEGFDLQELGNE